MGSGAAFLANAALRMLLRRAVEAAQALLLRLVVKLEMFDVMPLPSQEWILKLKEEAAEAAAAEAHKLRACMALIIYEKNSQFFFKISNSIIFPAFKILLS